MESELDSKEIVKEKLEKKQTKKTSSQGLHTILSPKLVL